MPGQLHARTPCLIGRSAAEFRRNLVTLRKYQQTESCPQSVRSIRIQSQGSSERRTCMHVGACCCRIQEHLLHRTQRRPGRSTCKNSLSARAESHGRSSHGCPPGLAGIHRAEGGPRRPCGGSRDVMGPGARFYRYFFEEWKSWPRERCAATHARPPRFWLLQSQPLPFGQPSRTAVSRTRVRKVEAGPGRLRLDQ